MVRSKLYYKLFLTFQIILIIPIVVQSLNHVNVETQNIVDNRTLLDLYSTSINTHFNNNLANKWDYNQRLLGKLLYEQPNLDISLLNLIINLFLIENSEISMIQIKIPGSIKYLSYYRKNEHSSVSIDQLSLLVSNEIKKEQTSFIMFDSIHYAITQSEFDWNSNEKAKLIFYINADVSIKSIENILGDSNVELYFKSIFYDSMLVLNDQLAINKDIHFIDSELSEVLNSKSMVKTVKPLINLETDVLIQNLPAFRSAYGIYNRTDLNANNEMLIYNNIYILLLLSILFSHILSSFIMANIKKMIAVLNKILIQISEGKQIDLDEFEQLSNVKTTKMILGKLQDALKERSDVQILLRDEENSNKEFSREKEITALYSKIDNFENNSTSNISLLLNQLNITLSLQTKIIKEFGGEITKYFDDRIVAIFYGENHSKRALDCALEVQKQIEIVRNTDNISHYLKIGLCNDLAILGEIKFANNIEHVVIGSVVENAIKLSQKVDKNMISVQDRFFDNFESKSDYKKYDNLKINNLD